MGLNALVVSSLWSLSAHGLAPVPAGENRASREDKPWKEEAEEPADPEDGPPRPREGGFTSAIRTGVSLPFARIASGPGNEMTNAFAHEIPILVETGYRPTPHLLIGAYFGMAFGGVAGDLEHVCSGCSARTTRLGLEGMYFFLPAERLNPWLGLGLGYEWTTVFDDSSVELSGPEYVHLLAGFDVRATGMIGFGPYVDVALGVYTDSFSPARTSTENVSGRTVHGWATGGVRIVFRP
jgi:hypothetical protein